MSPDTEFLIIIHHRFFSLSQGVWQAAIYLCIVFCYLLYFGPLPLATYVILRGSHAPGMLGTFIPPPRVSDPDMHHSTCVMYEPWCIPGSLTSSFLWSQWRRKLYRHSWCMHNPKFYVSEKRPTQINGCQWIHVIYPSSYFAVVFVFGL